MKTRLNVILNKLCCFQTAWVYLIYSETNLTMKSCWTTACISVHSQISEYTTQQVVVYFYVTYYLDNITR